MRLISILSRTRNVLTYVIYETTRDGPTFSLRQRFNRYFGPLNEEQEPDKVYRLGKKGDK